MNAGQLEAANTISVLVGTIALFLVVFLLHKAMKRILFQSAYLETLSDFAKARGHKKPISKWTFILLETAGVFLGFLFIPAFFKTPWLTFGVIFILLVIAVVFGVKFYVPPLKAFALAENLDYDTLNDGEDVVTGKHNNRDIFIRMKKEGVTPVGATRFVEQEGMVNLVKRSLSVSTALDDVKIKTIRYENGRVTTEPAGLATDFSGPEKMLGDIPLSGRARLCISTINGNSYLTLEKINLNLLFTAELYYLREITERILDSVANPKR